MRPAAFLLLLGLVLLSAVTAEHLTHCLKARQLAEKQPLPQCDENGNYNPQQCNGSHGVCWCVNTKGEEIAGTRTLPGQTPTKCEATGEKPGKCSVHRILKVCEKKLNPVCRSDWDCNGKQKCCDCNEQCRDPVDKKPGKCEVILRGCITDPNPSCRGDWDCNGTQKCCDYACHMQCRDPVA
ncbi:equistatin-like [Mixophyes fleayi]|uniref:equistatin-like n=1 Tax=Mixophyes fleayi TaxID=3061075 RepID=UPI003F4DF49B